MSLQLRFLMRWPSSTIKYFHGLFCKKRRSLIAISYDVIITGYDSLGTCFLLALRCLRLKSSRSLIVPWYRTTGIYTSDSFFLKRKINQTNRWCKLVELSHPIGNSGEWAYNKKGTTNIVIYHCCYQSNTLDSLS